MGLRNVANEGGSTDRLRRTACSRVAFGAPRVILGQVHREGLQLDGQEYSGFVSFVS